MNEIGVFDVVVGLADMRDLPALLDDLKNVIESWGTVTDQHGKLRIGLSIRATSHHKALRRVGKVMNRLYGPGHFAESIIADPGSDLALETEAKIAITQRSRAELATLVDELEVDHPREVPPRKVDPSRRARGSQAVKRSPEGPRIRAALPPRSR